MFQLTREEALRIQAEHCAHYERYHPGITAMVRDATNADALQPGKLYDVVEVNRHIPRGGMIEYMLGIHDQGGN